LVALEVFSNTQVLVQGREVTLLSNIPEDLFEDRVKILPLLGDVAFSLGHTLLGKEKSLQLCTWWDLVVEGREGEARGLELSLFYVAPFLTKGSRSKYLKKVSQRIEDLPPGSLKVLTHARFLSQEELLSSAFFFILLCLGVGKWRERGELERVVKGLLEHEEWAFEKVLGVLGGNLGSYGVEGLLNQIFIFLRERGMVSSDYRPLVKVDTLVKEIGRLVNKILEDETFLLEKTICAYCGKEFLRPEGPGRPRKFCSEKCKNDYFNKRRCSGI